MISQMRLISSAGIATGVILSAELPRMMPTTCISPTMKVMEDSSEKPIKKRLGCYGLLAKSKAGRKCIPNNSLHVKGNLKSEDVAVSGLFSSFVLEFINFPQNLIAKLFGQQPVNK